MLDVLKNFYGILLGVCAGVVLCIFATYEEVGNRHTRAIEVNKAQYNQKTGDFEYTDKELKYIITGERD